MSLVGLAGQALGGDTGSFRPPGGLQDLEQIPAQRLLQFSRSHAVQPVFRFQHHVAAVPKIVQIALLSGQKLFASLAAGEIQRAFQALAQFGCFRSARAVIGNELEQFHRHAGLRIERVDHLRIVLVRMDPAGKGRGGLHDMIRAAGHRHLAA